MQLIITLFLIALAAPAQAQWYLAGDLLQARYQEPQVDGTWRQNAVPSNRTHHANMMTLESLAWDVGAGYRFIGDDRWWTRGWAVEGGYRHYGSGVSSGGTVTDDHTYGQLLAGTRRPSTVTPSTYEATDRLQGGYLRVSKGLATWYGLEPYLSAGVEVLYHDLNFWARSPKGRMSYGGFTGVLAGPTLGGGVAYEVWRGIRARAGAEAHWLLTESGHPISSHWLTVGGGIEVPLAIFTGGTTRDYLWQR